MALTRKEKTIKRKWLAALRSGKYTQGRGLLFRPKRAGMTSGYGYCCLGVLQHVLDGGVECWMDNPPYDGGPSAMSVPSLEWYKHHGIGETLAGKEGGQYSYDYHERSALQAALVGMNDGLTDSGPKDFKEIADYIEENWV